FPITVPPCTHVHLMNDSHDSGAGGNEVRLLLVEDDTRLAGLLVRGFRSEGYAVDVAGTVQEARWSAGENPYDVLIFDVMLPDGDGFELCQQLRQQGNWTPVLMLTARDSVNDRVRGLDAGADDYLV